MLSKWLGSIATNGGPRENRVQYDFGSDAKILDLGTLTQCRIPCMESEILHVRGRPSHILPQYWYAIWRRKRPECGRRSAARTGPRGGSAAGVAPWPLRPSLALRGGDVDDKRLCRDCGWAAQGLSGCTLWGVGLGLFGVPPVGTACITLRLRAASVSICATILSQLREEAAARVAKDCRARPGPSEAEAQHGTARHGKLHLDVG